MSDLPPAGVGDAALTPPPVRYLDPQYRPPRPRRLARLLSRKLFLFSAGPAQVSWRDQGLTGPVRNQAPLNTCTSHAAAAMYEAWRRKAGEAAPSISPPFIHACVGGVGPNQGLDPIRLKERVNGQLAPAYQGAAAWPADQCQVAGGWPLMKLREVAGDEDAKAQLRARSPVVASLHITEGFYHLATAEYVPQGPDWSDHSVCLVGYTPSGWIAQNSFGADWGDGGYFHLGFGVGGVLRAGCPAVAIA